MPPGPEQQRLSPDERGNLVAYIDGELGDGESQAIQTKLALSLTARREVELLKKTWELLEHLPKPQPTAQFTERTLSEIKAIESRARGKDDVTRALSGRLATLSGVAALAALAFLAGIAASRWVWSDPLDRLAREMLLAEHLEEYVDVGSVEFLEALAGADEFGRTAVAIGPADSKASSHADPGELARNFERIRDMPVAQRDRLLRSLKKFDREIPPGMRASVETMNRRIEVLPRDERDKMHALTRRYHNWLGTLPDTEREELQRESSAADRLARARKLASRYPVPAEATPRTLQFLDAGGDSPFQSAAFARIWMALSTEQKQQIEVLAPGQRRHELVRLGSKLGLPDEITPAGYDPDEWIAKALDRLTALRAKTPLLSEAVSQWEKNAESSVAKKRPEFVEKMRRRRLRNQAANLYSVENPPAQRVLAGRLGTFFSALPPWMRGGFDDMPAEEARRRLEFVYRLAFPFPQEFKVASPPPPDPKSKIPARTAPAPKASATSPDAPF